MKFDESTFLTVRGQIAQAIAEYDAIEHQEISERSEVVQRDCRDGLVFKVNENALQPAPAEAEQVTHEFVMARIENFADFMGGEFGKLDARLAEMNKEIDRLKAIVESNNVTRLRGKDAA